MTGWELQALLTEGRTAADEHEPELVAAYELVIAGVGRQAARRFRERATVLTAAMPEWEPPPVPEDLVDVEAAARSASRRAGPVQERALEAVVSPLLAELGISLAIVSPLIEELLAELARRADTVVEGMGRIIADAIRSAHAEGLSVPQTARRILDRVSAATAWQATLLARSDLVAIGNGGTHAAVQAARTAGAEISTKTWLTAHDERVRPTHRAAEGQTVPVDQPFAVGVASLMWPGDPGGPWEEVANCRCTTLYDVGPVTASADVIADTGPEVSTLAMVAVYPRGDEADALAVGGGLEADDLHCTLVFLGEADDVDDVDQEAVSEAVALVASEVGAIAGSVGGIGHFAEGPDGVPAILLPDVQGLTLLRERIVFELELRGVRSPSEHGFLPHITQTYVASAADADARDEHLGQELHFDAVSVVVGGARTDYSLEGERVAHAAT